MQAKHAKARNRRQISPRVFNNRGIKLELDFIYVTLFNLAANLVYTIFALVISLIALVIVDNKLLSNVSIEEELKKGNLAISIFASTILLFVALIVTFGFKG